MEDVHSPQSLISEDETRVLKKEIRRASNQNGLMLLGMSVFTYVISGILIYLLRFFGKDRISPSLYISLIQLIGYVSRYFIVIPLIIFSNQILRKRRKEPIPAIRFSKPKVSKTFIGKWVIMGIGAVYAVNIVFSILFTVIQAVFNIRLHAPSMILGSSILDNMVTVIFFAFAAPFLEESFFRGALLNNTRRFGSWLGIIMVAVMFGLAHMNYQQIFYAAALGIIAGFVCIRAESLIPSVIIHFCINAVATVQSLILSHLDINKLTSGNFTSAYIFEHIGSFISILVISVLYFGVALAGFILLIMEIVNHRTEFRLKNECSCLSFKRKMLVYLTAPATLLFILLAVTETGLRAADTSLLVLIKNIF